VASKRVRDLLHFGKPFLIRPVIVIYRQLRKIHGDKLLKALLLPAEYKQRISALDRHPQ
jgi:hypothetical protein